MRWWGRNGGLIAILCLFAAACGNSDVDLNGVNGDVDPGFFIGETEEGGDLAIAAGSVRAIFFECGSLRPEPSGLRRCRRRRHSRRDRPGSERPGENTDADADARSNRHHPELGDQYSGSGHTDRIAYAHAHPNLDRAVRQRNDRHRRRRGMRSHRDAAVRFRRAGMRRLHLRVRRLLRRLRGQRTARLRQPLPDRVRRLRRPVLVLVLSAAH